uniref:AlNc14C118G6572 protein n=1 Tax=Albugo laibachii Nc14 TaxID=890382 RepID=F0WJ41_9STRA|nr:AlNc14C118G6572 [Albugo laibachii Nc14]|eukprot:CCA21287.1 AlNc14C118G6572 [Albugo laibachii Nc14]
MEGEGRKSVKGKHRKPKQFKNDGHSFELKLAVVKSLDTATMNETIELFFLALPGAKRQTKRRNIGRWRHQRAKIECMAAKQRTKNNKRERQEGTVTSLSVESERKEGTVTSLSVKSEREIAACINERCKDGISVS